MRRTIYIGGAAATFTCMSLLLSVTDFNAIISGEQGTRWWTFCTTPWARPEPGW
ncbi:hypothetical protein [Streptomyces sp. NBC_00443]|uniref:hypothetical protein n=1 Tax=Streptomyces sp. NBC_00443 TaxID=2975743 RepID=UPI002E1E9154